MATAKNLVSRLRHTVIIQALTDGFDAEGGLTQSWATLVTRRAAVEPLRGREYFAAQQNTAQVSMRIRLRYDTALAAVTPKHRVAFGSRTFDIESVINVEERNVEIQLMCVEQV